MNGDILSKTTKLIQDKYSVDDDSALKYSELALSALESHGGTSTNFPSIIKAVDVVVKSWLENDGLI